MAANRVRVLTETIGLNRDAVTLTAAAGKNTPTKSPDDIVIVAAVRTPIAKARRGAFKDTSPIDLLAVALTGALEKSGVDAKDVDDVTIGNVLLEGSGALFVRMAMFVAKIPDTASCRAINRQCSSGLDAIASAAAAIRSGYSTVAIAGGVESMSFNVIGASEQSQNLVKMSSALMNKRAMDCVMVPMGETSERVAEKFNVTRQQQDDFAFESYNRAIAAVKAGHFKNEIVPVSTVYEGQDGQPVNATVDTDEGPRPTSREQLAKLRPAFRKDKGRSTAGNSSQVSDGASACVLMKRAEAERRGIKILGVFRGYAVTGVDPTLMGIGPLYAIPKALKHAGVTTSDIDCYEINEAFASQALYCARELKLDMSKVNPQGGAIALGHPLGCTGSRMTATLLHYLHRTSGQWGVVSMCIGTGMGAAGVYSRE